MVHIHEKRRILFASGSFSLSWAMLGTTLFRRTRKLELVLADAFGAKKSDWLCVWISVEFWVIGAADCGPSCVDTTKRPATSVGRLFFVNIQLQFQCSMAYRKHLRKQFRYEKFNMYDTISNLLLKFTWYWICCWIFSRRSNQLRSGFSIGVWSEVLWQNRTSSQISVWLHFASASASA